MCLLHCLSSMKAGQIPCSENAWYIGRLPCSRQGAAGEHLSSQLHVMARHTLKGHIHETYTCPEQAGHSSQSTTVAAARELLLDLMSLQVHQTAADTSLYPCWQQKALAMQEPPRIAPVHASSKFPQLA